MKLKCLVYGHRPCRSEAWCDRCGAYLARPSSLAAWLARGAAVGVGIGVTMFALAWWALHV